MSNIISETDEASASRAIGIFKFIKNELHKIDTGNQAVRRDTMDQTAAILTNATMNAMR
jgi:hypothetical protein